MVDQQYLRTLEESYLETHNAAGGHMHLTIGVGTARMRLEPHPWDASAWDRATLVDTMTDVATLAAQSLTQGQALRVHQVDISVLGSVGDEETVQVRAEVMMVRTDVTVATVFAIDEDGVVKARGRVILGQPLDEADMEVDLDAEASEAAENRARQQLPPQRVWQTAFGPLFLN